MHLGTVINWLLDYVMHTLRTNGFIWITRAGGVTCSTATSTSGGGWGSTDTEEVSVI